ncbi:NUDIX domain-containing protein [Clostridium sp.]|uniref:NUDIX domain-containing protein n=1 Tax=Clostridium sp. TaxID=1506 RepID=UPI00321664B8
MVFNEVLGVLEFDKKNTRITSRKAIRGVAINNGKILMVLSNTGDYKFPGGGVKKHEDEKATLIREVLEETGYNVTKIREKVGLIIERSCDKFKKGALFQIESHYYFCDLGEEVTNQKLDDYEAKLEFTPIWVDIDKAIENNEKLLNNPGKNINSWIARETLVLKLLKDKVMKL